MNNCIKCNEETKNPRFCSRSCANSHSNKITPRRKPEGSCRTCQAPILTRKTWCIKCVPDEDHYKKLTLGEYRNKQSVKGKHPSWIHSHVRSFNRSWNKDLLTQSCEICSYSKHVELCHIKPVSSFSDDALLGEVNAKENNRVLCRNHHWEFDHNMLD